MVFTRGRAGLAEFSDEAAVDAALRPLREKVTFVDDPSCAVESATVTVRLRGGGTIAERVESARGNSSRPLADADLEEKLRDLARYAGAICDPSALIDAVWSLEDSGDAGAVMRFASA
jgi:2-methylcitrate dehydratase PrpD